MRRLLAWRPRRSLVALLMMGFGVGEILTIHGWRPGWEEALMLVIAGAGVDVWNRSASERHPGGRHR